MLGENKQFPADIVLDAITNTTDLSSSLKSQQIDSDSIKTPNPDFSIRAKNSDGKTTHLFRQDVRNIINNFMETRRSYPYATKSQKRMLCKKTGMSISQVSMYMSNWRRRNLSASEKNRFRRSFNLKNKDDFLA